VRATSNADAKKEPSRRSDAGDYKLRDGSVTHSQCRIVNAKHVKAVCGTGS
jgi:hypothetical protein